MPVSDQHFAKRIGKHHLAVLTAFAAANPDHSAFAIKVAYFEAGQFRNP